MSIVPLKIGIIGAGKMTMKRHLPALVRLQKEGQCTIVGICDINIDAARAAASAFAIPTATHNAQELIERTDIDAMCIFAPADVHYREGLATLRAKKHLFVEKPPAKNTQQVKELVSLAKVNGLIAASGFNRRFQKHILEVTAHLRGTSVQSAEAVFNKSNAGTVVPFGMRSWLGVSAIHALDTLCFVMGERPTALHSAHNGTTADLLENFSALISWGDQHAVFSANNSAGSRVERYAFHGYGVSYAVEGKTLRVNRGADEKEGVFIDEDTTSGIYAEFASFFEAIRSGIPPPHALERTIAALYLVELIEQGHSGAIDWSPIESDVVSVREAEKGEAMMHTRSVGKGKLSVLVLNPHVLHAELPMLQEHFRIVYRNDVDGLSEDEKQSVAAVVTGGPGATALDTSLLEKLPKAAVLGVLGASVKRWGGEDALSHGMAVINTADVYADAVAEFIVMQALVGLRRASVSHEVMRKGGWEFSVPQYREIIKDKIRMLAKNPIVQYLKPYLSSIRPMVAPVSKSKKASVRMLSGRTIGILGFGEITKKTIPLFQAFGCKVIVHSEHLDSETARSLGVVSGTLDEVLRADVVSMQRGLSARTARAFGSQEIGALRSGTVFINSGRAGLVDTDALVARLKKGDIFACLDVYDEEPLPANDILRTLPNVFLTSHLAASIHHTEGLLAASSRTLAEKIVAYVKDGSSSTIDQSYLSNMT